MSILNYVYDATGQLVDNLIENEIHAVDRTVNCVVFPTNHAFFAEGLVIEGMDETETYSELLEGIDFAYSPLFLSASAQTTGKLVFTYIILLTDVSSVRLRYQTLGQYQDEKLLAQIVATTFDYSRPYAWAQLEGQVLTFNTMVREGSLKGLSLIEVLTNQMQLISSALSHPNTNKLNLALDITRLEEKITTLVTTSEFNAGIMAPTSEIEVLPLVSKRLCVVPSKKNVVKGIFYYEAADGSDSLSMDLLFTKGITATHTETNERGNANITITTLRSGDEVIVSVTALKAGNIKFKILAEI